MNALLRPFVAICLLRMGPQELPTSRVLLGITLVAHASVGTVFLSLLLDAWRALAAGVTGTIVLATLTGTLLALTRLPDRFVQTLAALAGCDALITLIALPVMIYAHGASGESLAGLLMLALVIWSIAVFGHVLRHALSTSMVIGVVVALVFYWVSIGVLDHLYMPAT